jgi:hypothetical protein
MSELIINIPAIISCFLLQLYYSSTLSVSRHYAIGWQDDWCVINWKGFVSKQSWRNQKSIIMRDFPGESPNKHLLNTNLESYHYTN